MKEIGITFSGGGINGFSYLGVIKRLDSQNIFPSLIGGTSVGAIFGALYSAGYSYKEMILELERIEGMVSKIKDFDIKNLGKAVLTLNLTHSNGLLKGDKILEEVEYLLSKKGIRKLSDFKIPFFLQMTDLNTGENVCVCSLDPKYKDKSPLPYIRASFSMPGLFKPKEIEGKYFYDGGVKANSPILSAGEVSKKYSLGITNLMALNVKKEFREDSNYQDKDFINIWFRSISMLVHEQYNYDKEFFKIKYPHIELNEVNFPELYKDSMLSGSVIEIAKHGEDFDLNFSLL